MATSDAVMELFKRYDVPQGTALDRVPDWPASRLEGFVAEISAALPRTVSTPTSPHRYVANSQLSGAPSPCMSIQCRMNGLDQLARFSAWYADGVYVHDPFESHHGVNPYDVAVGIEGLYRLRYLIDAGLVAYIPVELRMCGGCFTKAFKSHTGEWVFDRASSWLDREYRASVTFTAELADDSRVLVSSSGPRELIEHGGGGRLVPYDAIPKRLLARLKQGKARTVSPALAKSAKLFESETQDIVGDVCVQHYYGRGLSSRYLTSRPVDLAVLQAMLDDEHAFRHDMMVSAFSHDLPFVADIGLEPLIKLRQTDGEAFVRYRNALTQAVGDAGANDPNKFRQVFEDVVLPEVDKVQHLVSTSRSMFRTKAGVTAAVGLALAAIGGAAAGPLGLGLGLAGLVAGLGVHGAGLIDAAAEAQHAGRDNEFYFLWRAKRL